ncbi:hypothetical protein GLOIN_2v1668985 [Rhizophagus irregularis DAOM 181602=DAOM 197198]|uniref:Uncharacterized protein n=1 Tax=Rhizophagus irregularis (strain DAOM 181602 / DAOM 197198 / MUCL 43194) TaxID=747089 RepID=A0A2P4PIG6_RHIID|nr:hypothetical protein GLOIN_2v1668985 [Rhizophagus irregularis DAOM 181602=DAOM 197198]POG65192.1 hypothetical protein GLOIN_2v1668985 [Rhizophagus irregularis DAOM 181602=DAOM 197198]|eukprot:XP_025172058.1 hypothetical protein GLOIN_2v1668985 [Rhizophagus irregularis DAOM 181602=DAOM 197198]
MWVVWVGSGFTFSLLFIRAPFRPFFFTSLFRYVGLLFFLYVFLSYKFCIARYLILPIHKISINWFIIFFFFEHKL